MRIICLVFMLCCCALQAQVIDVQHLALDLQFDWTKQQAQGKADITINLLQAANTISLDAADLNIHAVTMGNKQLNYHYQSGSNQTKLIIVLDAQYAAGERLQLQITYNTTHVNHADPISISGSFGKGLRFMQPTTTTPLKRKQIWSSGEPDGNAYWFPHHAAISDVYTFDISATVDQSMMLISCGNLVETQQISATQKTFRYRTHTPIPAYLAFIVVGEYEPVKRPAGNTEIVVYGYPDERTAVEATTILLPEMLTFLERETGYTYPFDQYGMVVVQDYPFPGRVGQHVNTILSDNYIDDAGVHADYQYLWDGVAVQALANQWFGNCIQPAQWEDLWLSKAFGQYYAGLFTEYVHGAAEYQLWYYPFEIGNLLNDIQNGNRHPLVPDTIADVQAFVADSYATYKGALVLRMLRKELGEQIWKQSLTTFFSTYANKQVSTRDFQHCIERVSGKSYQWFFDQWVYQDIYPEFEVSTAYAADTKKLALKIVQLTTQPENPNAPQYVQGKIDIEIDAHVYTIQLEPKQEQVFYFDHASEPTFINFNMHGLYLCNYEQSKSTPSWFAQLEQSNDVLAKQEAITQLLEFAIDTTQATNNRQVVVDVFLKEIAKDAYWRYRYNAIGGLSYAAERPFTPAVRQVLLNCIQEEQSWLKSAAITVLGSSKDSAYIDLYIQALNDTSDRVVTAAAIAIGNTQSSLAYDLLMQLEHQPSWKNQNRIAALYGLQALGDTRAVEYALACLKDNTSPRWYLATPVWDYPFTAAYTLWAFNQSEAGFNFMFERFKQSLLEQDINDIFQNLQLLEMLDGKEMPEVYTMLKNRFSEQPEMLEAVIFYEQQYIQSHNP